MSTTSPHNSIRGSLASRAEEEGWSWFRVTVTAKEIGATEILHVPAHNARQSQTNAMFLLEMSLRGQTVEYDVEPLEVEPDSWP